MNTVLKVEKLEVFLKTDFWTQQKRILHELSFEVCEGQIYGFLALTDLARLRLSRQFWV